MATDKVVAAYPTSRSVRIDDQLWDRVGEAAERRRISRSVLIRQAIKEHLHFLAYTESKGIDND
jgi:predicted transcriptional regulator